MGKKLSQEEVIRQFRQVHGDKYDYSLVEYINTDTKVKIICPEHGIFEQTPYKHIHRKQGCPYCSRNVLFTKEKFIEECKKTHTINYDYSKVNYINAQQKVEIICPIHGSFWQKANIFRRGGNCPKCVGGVRYTLKDFLEKAKKFHGDFYDYSKVNYINDHTKVEIICPIHGSYFIYPSQHLKERRGECPNCARSNGEKFITNWLIKNGYEQNKDFFNEFKFDDCKDITNLRFDFFIPQKKILIEFNGMQHYKPVKRFGGLKHFKKQIRHDEIKRKYAKNNNLILLEIPYTCKNVGSFLEENVGRNKN